ncbi:hypothetical protein FPV67DRAFT_1662755 [Lyophyllum atratum]|nr:hypothetical protein FPV67DRAFT_1662755 [Lyophyllum atratum]
MSASSKARKSDPCSSSLTPQRKHRKLLKDGSGTEVWPESIESIFVKGLHEYWESPWATYSQSRGRSRWRNQFLVDYLQKAGIGRTKKQVASHIQVLRNMWKGEPEFYLVAGSDEPGLPDTPVKLEDRSLIPLDFDETDGTSSSSASPDFSPPDFQSDFPPSPNGLSGDSQPTNTQTTTSKGSPNVSPYSRETIFTTSIPSSLSLYPTDISGHQSHEHLPVQNAHYSLGAYSSSYPQACGPCPKDDARLTGVNRVSDVSAYSSHSQSPNRTTAICLLADGMSPLSIKLDALMPSQDPTRTTLALKIRLHITPVDDIRSSSTLHGFFGTISLSRLWVTSGKCITRVYVNNTCISEEVDTLEVSNIDMGTVNAMLPESSLSRCRWLDASLTTSVTQEIIVDGQTLIYLIYDLDRNNGNIMPSAELLGYQNRKATAILSSSHSPNSTTYPAFLAQSRHAEPTSPSYALTPINSMRHVAATSMSF